MFFKLINKFDIEQKQEVKHNPLQTKQNNKTASIAYKFIRSLGKSFC